MKTPSLLCRWVQLRVALVRDAQAPPPQGCRRHLAACSRCRRELAAEAALETRLLHHPALEPRTAPAGLNLRILAALRREVSLAAAVAASQTGWWKPALAVGVLLLLLAGGPIWPSRHRAPPSAASSPSAAPFTVLVVPTNLLELDAEKFFTLTARLDSHLQEELDRVLNDLRTAGQSLVAAFGADTDRP